ncbi:hypothetical protein LWI28_017404 [Acer negundo]|uniref:Uncharacterized protein n=1 Tax=Acer negundo TaxID=4023 RepID=A0AAD5IS24_ACENE|nr:hypothetical protein LWI28_017404 [Acer negundo]
MYNGLGIKYHRPGTRDNRQCTRDDKQGTTDRVLRTIGKVPRTSPDLAPKTIYLSTLFETNAKHGAYTSDLTLPLEPNKRSFGSICNSSKKILIDKHPLGKFPLFSTFKRRFSSGLQMALLKTLMYVYLPLHSQSIFDNSIFSAVPLNDELQQVTKVEEQVLLTLTAPRHIDHDHQ